MKILPFQKQWLIRENDGSGPLPKEVDTVLVKFNWDTGDPDWLITTPPLRIGSKDEYEITCPELRDKRKIQEIVDYLEKMEKGSEV